MRRKSHAEELRPWTGSLGCAKAAAPQERDILIINMTDTSKQCDEDHGVHSRAVLASGFPLRNKGFAILYS
jgi:hypothetical protein